MEEKKFIRSQSTTPIAPLGILGVGLSLLAVLVLAPAPAAALTVGADIEVDAECVGLCLTDLRTCLADARADFVDCSIDNGCVELSAAARLACKADKTASVCLEARAEYTECIRPCRAQLRADVKACQNASLNCLHDECALTDLPEQCSRVSVAVD